MLTTNSYLTFPTTATPLKCKSFYGSYGPRNDNMMNSKNNEYSKAGDKLYMNSYIFNHTIISFDNNKIYLLIFWNIDLARI